MSQKDFDRILVTAALPYANGPIHLGHLAGAYLPPDMFCRYQRLKGEDVVFVCGSDEMGVAIMIRARNEGVSPKDIVDRYHPMITDSFEKFGMSFDNFSRTTNEIHSETSQEFFRNLAEKDVFSLKTEQQLFDPEAGMFLADRFVVGTCPSCGNDNAYGDQCEKCGTTLSPMELVNPRSTITDATPELRETTHWYLPLGDFQERLEKWIDTHPEWKPNVLGQIKSWLNDGLRERAITRDVPWGVPVPQDVAEKIGVDASGKVIYVWFDAPIGYISATKEWAKEQGKPEAWKSYWQDEKTRLVHFIGKDNIVFHCLMFPAMLMAHGDYVLPDNVPANEFLNIEGSKLSTSRNWAVWLHEYLEDLDPDLLRYALATMLPETKDADFNWNEFQTRVNSELADVLGNFVNRTMTFAHRFAKGKVPELVKPDALDQEVIEKLKTFPDRIGSAYDNYRNREAVFETMALARMGNKYFNDSEPWHSRKTNAQQCANTIHVSLQICASLAVLMEPVLPFSAIRMRKMLGMEGVRSSEPGQSKDGISWDDAGQCLLPVGQKLGESEILFSKIEDDVIEEQKAKLGGPEEEVETSEPYEPVKEIITYDDFVKLDFRMGTVLSAERIPKSKKLLKLQIDLGFEQRQILAGAAEHFEPESLVGQQVAVVANLAPRKMMGMESQGMVLMAEDRTGALSIMQSSGEDGAVIR
ncbi:MAG: methionine--tRNA ligase [Bacteroidetes Order II. Incertae sedis bacterium]|jgi:methionyl-tRNA synthetase|nr:methionine--tRNA ligase [Bacteroidetes Order II. bacterium]MBT4602905.1 methionine--tRNA ligase [Bacteroidetes Order II. bacterium]MBT5250133.1 methionine--tRNA ligase [Bacteroidetes Order II. bacterium]MBT6201862.1 methionine--tRNA ligase [Bacteroidetes Order II. bacterium]MBT6424396.1 methionine--tRNA ligase [Bacteroidetes Order II. bacterium]